jgi:hypothetical protein
VIVIEGTIKAERYIRNLDEVAFIQELDSRHGQIGCPFPQDEAP